MTSIAYRLLAVLAFALCLIAPVATPARAQANAIAVSSAGATPDFPNGVTFSVSATSERSIVKAELLYTKAEQETLNLVEADVTPGQSVDVSLPVDFRANYVPPGIDVSYRWRLTDDAGNVAETDPATITWEDTRFPWDSVSTDEVTVHVYTGNKGFAQKILDSAQSTIDSLQASFGLSRSQPIQIWAYGSKSDFQGSQAPNSQEWIAGTAYPELQVILAVLPDGDEREIGRVVPHEISHQVLYQSTRNPFNVPPTWLDEGLAVAAQKSGNEGFQAMVQSAVEANRLFSVRSLTSEFPYDPADASLAYAESYSVVQFLLGRWGNEGMGAIIDGYRQGLSHDDALMQAIGVDVDGLDALWKASLDGQAGGGVTGNVGGTAEPSIGARLLQNVSAILLGLAVAVSGGFMFIRRIAGRHDPHDPSDLPLVV